MKKNLLAPGTLLCSLFLILFTSLPAQDFVWKKGGNQVDLSGVYGTQGVAATGNDPGSREAAISWRDANGDFWLFGGSGYDNAGVLDYLNDLWKYNKITGQWTWVNGSTAVNQFGIYGTQGSFAATNVPGARKNSVSWVDGSGNLWLLGGYGYDAIGSLGELNDLWVFDISLGQWKWVKGTNAAYQMGTYGTQGNAAPGNVPGGRYSAVSWVDNSGNFWLFGGYGYATSPTQGSLNDLWHYNPGTNQWTWMKGNNSTNNFGIYGTQGTAAPGNMPGGRANASAWIDLSGNLWLHGGYGYASVGAADLLSDLWQYNIGTNQWTWFKGNNTNTAQQGVYGTQGLAAPGNMPGARYSAISWADGLGDLWLFGGYAFDTGNIPDFINDLWRYDMGTNQWTWVKGSNTVLQPGAYGIQNVISSLNMPGARGGAVSWKDGSNNLWLFGGTGYDAVNNVGDLNDVWKFFNCIDPVMSINSTSNTVCAGTQVTLTANGATTYTWQGQQTTSTIVVGPFGTSSYTVYGTDVNECSSEASYTLTILDLPVITASISTAVICAGETTSLIAGGGSTYTWTSGDNGATVTVTPVSTTNYTVTGYDSNGCYSTAEVTQSVSACVGLAENIAAAEVLLYPNPNHGAFTVQTGRSGTATLRVFNALGQQVAEQELAGDKTPVILPIAAGLYHYQLQQADKMVTSGKLIVE